MKIVKLKKKLLKARLKGIATVIYFTDKKINLIAKVVNLKVLRKLKRIKNLHNNIDAFQYVHGLGKGIPSDEAFKNIYWRSENKENFGMIWFAPVLDAKPSMIERFVNETYSLFMEKGFECPITLTFVKPEKVIAIININFNKFNTIEKKRAYELYNELNLLMKTLGLKMYRGNIQSMDKITYTDQSKEEVFKVIKSVLDPKGVISPGRYGIK